MQLRIWTAIVIFVGSYFPLSMILLAQDYDPKHWHEKICLNLLNPQCVIPFEHASLSISMFVVCLVCLLISLFVFRATPTKRKLTVVNAKYVPAELMNYTLPYVVSFMGVSFAEEGKFAGMLIFLGWIFWITHKSGQLILNPMLVVFGWRLYDITYEFSGDSRRHDGFVLSDAELLAGDVVDYGVIQDVMVIRKSDFRVGND